jgi:hypothetical protein
MKFAMSLMTHNKAGITFPPHVARDVKEARNLRKLVREQGRPGALGHVQGERALARLAHGHAGEETLEDIYARQGAFARPYLPGEGSAGGQGSLTQADVTPGKEPTKKPGGGA